MNASLACIFQKFVADTPLVISYNQQCHTETKLNYLCAIIISILMDLLVQNFFFFSIWVCFCKHS